MKLHAPGPGAQAEGLDGHVIARRQEVGAGGQVDGVFVPLEDAIAGLEGAEQRVAPAQVRDPQRFEAQFAHRCPVDRCVEGACQHLRAEADAEHRQPGVNRPPHQRSLAEQIGMPVDLVNIHLPAEHDQAPDFLEVRPPDVGLEGIEAHERDTRLAEHRGRDPERVVAVIPNTKDGLHRVR